MTTSNDPARRLSAGRVAHMRRGAAATARLIFSVLAFAALLVAAHPERAHAEDETEYADLGRWRIVAVSAGGMFGYCAADTDNGEVQLRIATNGRRWQIGNPYYETGNVTGQWGFDGLEDEAVFAAEGDGWASTDLTRDMMEGLKASPSITMELDRGQQTWKLRGVRAAMAKATECARNKGRSGGSVAAEDDGGGEPSGGRKIRPLEGPNCPAAKIVTSINFGNQPAKVRFVNRLDVPVSLYWIDFDGNWVLYTKIRPGAKYMQQTYTGHAWVGWTGQDCVPADDWHVKDTSETTEWHY